MDVYILSLRVPIVVMFYVLCLCVMSLVPFAHQRSSALPSIHCKSTEDRKFTLAKSTEDLGLPLSLRGCVLSSLHARIMRARKRVFTDHLLCFISSESHPLLLRRLSGAEKTRHGIRSIDPNQCTSPEGQTCSAIRWYARR